METRANNSSPATSAMQKLERFFDKLPAEEQKVISEMVRAALIQAAGNFEDAQDTGASGKMNASTIPAYVNGLTGQSAPSLVKSLAFPGKLVAYSIPGCNASALVAIRAETVKR